MLRRAARRVGRPRVPRSHARRHSSGSQRTRRSIGAVPTAAATPTAARAAAATMAPVATAGSSRVAPSRVAPSRAAPSRAVVTAGSLHLVWHFHDRRPHSLPRCPPERRRAQRSPFGDVRLRPATHQRSLESRRVKGVAGNQGVKCGRRPPAAAAAQPCHPR